VVGVDPTTPVSPALIELQKLVGVETRLDAYHGALRRAAQSAAHFATHGAVLVTCSDEFQGELRVTFERDVARPLTSGSIVGQRNVFSLSNMAGRLEVGALELAQQHFSLRSASGQRTIVVEIMAHCGVIDGAGGSKYGRVDRFGQTSECCGALSRLIESGDHFAAVRHPWFEQLSAFFGADRIAALRQIDPSTRLLIAAAVHAVLQGESGVADTLRTAPQIPTHFLIACGVVLNRSGADTVLPVALHHLRAEGGDVAVVHGASLRSTPQSMRIAHENGHVRVVVDEELPSITAPRIDVAQSGEFANYVRRLEARSDERSTAQARSAGEVLFNSRRRFDRLKKRPQAWRVYARPVLRGLMQSLAVVAPEHGLVAMLVQSGHDSARAERLRDLLQKGPTTDEARRALHEIEADIQQLGHRDAQQVLEVLLGDGSPFFG